MKLELFKDGQLYMTIEAVGDIGDDFEIIPKRLMKDSSLSDKTFKELYYKFAKDASSYPEAYEQAEQVHEKYFEKRRYSGYESFRQILHRDTH